jgi:hypothetical protein
MNDRLKLCPGTELNRYPRFGGQDFKSCVSTNSTTGAPMFVTLSQSTNKKFHLESRDGIGAEDEARTRDLNLGKVALYQLSYFRIVPQFCNSGKIVPLICNRGSKRTFI